MLVDWVGDDGLIGIWNCKCDGEMQLGRGDKVVDSNGISDPNHMLESFRELGAFRLQVRRGPYSPAELETQMPLACQVAVGSILQQVALEHTAAKAQREEGERARRLEASVEDEAKKKEASQLLLAGPADLQRMLAERLARSQKR